ncbi:MAG: SDR family oxidoreductase [Zhengella sp.]|uniref:SDR family oxidoreductase n=1 Tax=Zhengella sp. TaxID=2282762 RepID=UPI001E1A1FBC|nr:SDR family oxidoreductase [Notoacmeibacter sp.]
MLENRTILITGAARGLGREIALACGRAGARLVLADIDGAGAAESARLVAQDGGTARAAHVDLASAESIAELAAGIADDEGRLDGLVNNGAIATGIGGKTLDEIDIETWDRVMAVNVRGLWLMTRAAVPLLAQSHGGRIVNIASDTAIWGAPRLLTYVASKGAVMSMTHSLARELGPKGIGVTAVAPGILTTESTEYVPEERHRLYESGRAVPGPQGPQDVTGTIVFLLGPDALTLTGQVLPVNRGFVFK